MAYGDSVDWNGKVPPAKTTVIWQTDFFCSQTGVQQTITARFKLPPEGSPASAVVDKMVDAWNEQNPHACPAIRIPNQDKIKFEMNVDGRQIIDMRFKVGTNPGPFTHVPYENFIEVVAGLKVCNSF